MGIKYLNVIALYGVKNLSCG